MAHVMAEARVFDFEPPIDEAELNLVAEALNKLGIDDDFEALRGQIAEDIEGAQEFMNLM